ncbi:MAG: single-stranded-DNA-specific exonuclease RecJ [Fimbriimonadaceae bacterium]|nr:single-stranded-DNA-specific exonuclease RecJ [Fimbriimonadaceae bacterium]
MRRPVWQLAPSRRDEALALQQSLGLHPVVAHILLNRGLTAAEIPAFLEPSRLAPADPSGIPDLDAAAARLAEAIRHREKVVIYGDYDADGTCAGALLSRFLARFEVPHSYYVPDRFDEGYGVNAKAVVEIVTRHKPGLIVTVDCGIASAEEIDTAVALGTAVIVTDHHQVPARLPKVPAVNPHRAESTYPFKDLCGAAVIHKVCGAVAELLDYDFASCQDLHELAAIGTVADVMPLRGENRHLVQRGLATLPRTGIVGLQALLEVARLGADRTLTARDIGFGIGPRLNAPGRLESADQAYRLLVTSSRAEAFQIAEALEQLNRERRELEERLALEAEQIVAGQSLHDTWGLVVAAEGWHEGVLGLVAGRLSRQHHRPVLALSITGDTVKGSGRSTAAVNLHAALTACADLLERFGGHPRAAGLTLTRAQLPALVERFDSAVKQQVTADALVPQIQTECAVKGSALTIELAEQLATLAPFGEGNPEPLFEMRGLRLQRVAATRDGQHLQLQFGVDGRETRLKAFWPRQGRLAERLHEGSAVSVAGSLGIDSWQGRRQPQIMVEDLHLEAG